MVLLALSIIGGNLPNSYSLALSFQNVHSWFVKVPRFLWTVGGTAVYIGIGIAAAYDFAESLTTFMSILSYYLAMYTTIVLEEHFIFRHTDFSNYQLEGWNDKYQLPYGFASMLAFCFGIMGVVLGMAQVWYIGVIGRQIGDPAYGGDIAFELAACFCGIIYPIARVFEKRYLGR
jgi:purine-cytosine permease-like protein